MQVELLSSNRSEGRALYTPGLALRVCLSLMLALVFCVSAAEAQNDLTSKPATSETSAEAAGTATVQTRSRRVVETQVAVTTDAAENDSSRSVDDPPLMIG